MNLGTEAHFRSVLDQDRAGVLLSALEQSAERALALAAAEGFRQARTRPTVAFDLATTMLEETFGVLPGVTKATSLGQILWVIDQIYGIRIKRLDMGYQPANHVSGQQTLIAAQEPLPDLQPLIFVCAGVRYSERTGLPVDYVVVKHYPGTTSKQETEWIVDLRELAQAMAAMPTSPMLPGTPPAEIKVRPARSRRLVAESGT